MSLTKEQIKILEDQIQSDIREVMSTEAGRRFIFRQLDQSGLYRSISASGYRTNETYAQMGRREQGLQLLSEVTRYAIGSYQLMLKENDNG